ncbi:MAG: c-type cytochrome, partial [Planctomycetota bacterium]|nr:c-type cytochrome [Planctomycetota bacterium]
VQTLGPKYRQQLVNYRFPDVRRKATELLGQIDEDRERIIADYTASLTLTGDATRGKLHYEKNCASCHETAAREYPLAPHLSELTRREAESLLIAILDPNRSVEPKYQRFRIATESGEIFEGRIGADGEDSISLVDAQGKISIVPRETILSIQSGPSLMPEGLEKEISPEQMVDLLAYLIQGT